MLRAERLGKAGTFLKAFSSALLLLVSFEFDTCGEPEALGSSIFDVSDSSGVLSTIPSGFGTVALSDCSPLEHGAKSHSEMLCSLPSLRLTSAICFQQFKFFHHVIIFTGAYVVYQKHRARPKQPCRQRFSIRRLPIKTKKLFVQSSICTRTQERVAFVLVYRSE